VEVPVQSNIYIDTTDDGEANGTTYIVGHEELNIANNKGVELPSTGGEGTMMMITIGTMIAMAFAVLLITQKKMSIYQD
jgi:LPXTG-motif cell wall-anchored protein